MKLPSWADQLTEQQQKALRHQREDMRTALFGNESVLCCHPDHQPFVIATDGRIHVLTFECDPAFVFANRKEFVSAATHKLEFTATLSRDLWMQGKS